MAFTSALATLLGSGLPIKFYYTVEARSGASAEAVGAWITVPIKEARPRINRGGSMLYASAQFTVDRTWAQAGGPLQYTDEFDINNPIQLKAQVRIRCYVEVSSGVWENEWVFRGFITNVTPQNFDLSVDCVDRLGVCQQLVARIGATGTTYATREGVMEPATSFTFPNGTLLEIESASDGTLIIDPTDPNGAEGYYNGARRPWKPTVVVVEEYIASAWVEVDPAKYAVYPNEGRIRLTYTPSNDFRANNIIVYKTGVESGALHIGDVLESALTFAKTDGGGGFTGGELNLSPGNNIGYIGWNRHDGTIEDLIRLLTGSEHSLAYRLYHDPEADTIVGLDEDDFYTKAWTSVSTGTVTGVSSTTILIDSGATFQADGVEVGAKVELDSGAYAYVVTVDSQIQLTTSVLSGSDTYDAGDDYTVSNPTSADVTGYWEQDISAPRTDANTFASVLTIAKNAKVTNWLAGLNATVLLDGNWTQMTNSFGPYEFVTGDGGATNGNVNDALGWQADEGDLGAGWEDTFYDFLRYDIGAVQPIEKVRFTMPFGRNPKNFPWGITILGSLDNVSYYPISPELYKRTVKAQEQVEVDSLMMLQVRYIKIQMAPNKWVMEGPERMVGLAELQLLAPEVFSVYTDAADSDALPPPGGSYGEVASKFSQSGYSCYRDDEGLVLTEAEAKARSQVLLFNFVRFYLQVTYTTDFDPRFLLYKTIDVLDELNDSPTTPRKILVESVDAAEDKVAIVGRDYYSEVPW